MGKARPACSRRRLDGHPSTDRRRGGCVMLIFADAAKRRFAAGLLNPKLRGLTVAPVMAFAALLGACSDAPPQAPAPPLVSAGYPLERNVVDWDDYVGRFEAIQDVEVRPRVSGQITRIGFRDGLKVGKGQFLFQIDPRPYAAALAQARADQARAAATFG